MIKNVLLLAHYNRWITTQIFKTEKKFWT